MASSLKDALTKSGLAQDEPAPPKQDSTKWKNELPEDHAPHMPFDAPARIKMKDKPKR